MSGIHNILLGQTGVISLALVSGSGTVGGPASGYFNGSFGTLTPNSLLGLTVNRIIGVSGGTPSTQIWLAAGVDPGQNLWKQVSLNGTLRSSAAATYTFSGGNAQWSYNSNTAALGSNGTILFFI